MSFAAAHLMRSPQTKVVITTTALRALFLVALLIILNSIIDFGTSPLLLGAMAALGVVAATSLAARALLSRGMFTGATLLLLLYIALRSLLPFLSTGGATLTLYPAVLELHSDAVVTVFAIAFLSTWSFWRWRIAATVELVAIGAGGVLLFLGHRQFHFDTPQIVNTLAWRLNVSELSLLIWLGAGLTFLTIMYSWLASWAPRPLGPDARRTPHPTPGRTQWGRATLIIAVIACAAGFVVYELHSLFSRQALARLASGVGQETQEGLSPLNFDSSVGRSQQPLALARLDGDYPENPLAPKLYLRENVLSKMDGHNFVIAPREFDRDLNRSNPSERYVGQPDSELVSRIPVVQSIYLLAPHDNAFAIDFPISITPLKNPNPSRFKGAYKAYSMAPGYALSDLKGRAVGDPRWSDAERRLYLEQHDDTRYREKALDIVGESNPPIEQAQEVIQFLNKNAIYTLTPNHNVAKGADPVAPFLFGDMRGFCVHFAHATVAMLRGLGIPSRVATGYATDLREAKDGHILLRTNDRHAWAEVYVHGLGWLPFDTDPQHVESHAEAPVDQQILDELMAMLGPDEEILPEDIAKDEPGADPPAPWRVPSLESFLLPAALFVALFILAKLFLRFGWRLAYNPEARALWAYRGMASALLDSGFPRAFGETHLEYSQRIERTIGVPLSALSKRRNARAYGGNVALGFTGDIVDSEVQLSESSFRKLPLWRRCLGFLNPASLVRAALRRWW